MNLDINAIIADEKIREYLLTPRNRNDKSRWLSEAGYTLENWRDLQNDIREQLLHINAQLCEKSTYGKMFEIIGELNGPNNFVLFVRSFWIIETNSGLTKFVTMYPDRKRGNFEV